MIVGAALYAELYSFFKLTVLAWKDLGKLGLPEAVGISEWAIVALLWVGIVALFFWFEKRRL
jgi:hypothetical protein